VRVNDYKIKAGAYLTWANLTGAFGIVRLPVGDPRGYDAVAGWHESGWMVSAGCRWFTVEEARKHWGDDYEGFRSIADRYRYALDWLEKQPTS